ncbi:MAG: type IV toxin-antitoxin system AbiEi family antitoxin [Prevotellaceae bacterium]|jgi:hypothetical protein|nr:type IV toxin-antitoxin system AbiEi family antitoxin [Prevotellaceae bacterium]
METREDIKYGKINKLMQEVPKGLVLLSMWLHSEGYSYELQQRYRNSGWLKSIGIGAMLKNGDELTLAGALAALQGQLGMDVHVGGRSALELQGVSHYLQLNEHETTVFTESKTALPAWFTRNRWTPTPKVFRSTLYNKDEVGMTNYQDGEFAMKISTPARAVMECLYLCPNQFSLQEAYELMEGLPTLRPSQVQPLLEECKSVKVKRLFLYFAERANHAWLKHVDVGRINLGKGDRSLATDGAYVPKYHLVLPKELV